MTLTYEDALQEVLTTVRAGAGVEAAMGRFPEHAAALQEDVRVSQALVRLAHAVPEAPVAARLTASRRMLAQLDAERERANRRSAGWSRLALSPRFAMATGIAAVITVIAAAVALDSGGGATVEAATIEGVVVDNDGGRLTVQTLDALEQVTVPKDAPVSDAGGAPIGLDSITVGQVVTVEVERREREAIARNVLRSVDSIGAWCEGAAERCRALSDRLERSRGECDPPAPSCLLAADRLDQLRDAVDAAVRLEALKQDCRAGAADACRQLVTFCRENPAICHDVTPQSQPADRPDGLDRPRDLNVRCAGGDETACRRLAQICIEDPALCPAEVMPADSSPLLEPTLPPAPTRAPAATATRATERATEAPAPTVPLPSTRDRAIDATATPVRDVAPSVTPVRAETDSRPTVEPTPIVDGPLQDARPPDSR